MLTLMTLLDDAGLDGWLNIVRKRRARVVFPLDEGPESPTMNVFWASGPWERRPLVAEVELMMRCSSWLNLRFRIF